MLLEFTESSLKQSSTVVLLEIIAVLPKLFAFGVSALTFALLAAIEPLGRPSLIPVRYSRSSGV